MNAGSRVVALTPLGGALLLQGATESAPAFPLAAPLAFEFAPRDERERFAHSMSTAPALFWGAQDTRRLKISVLPIELHGQASDYRVSAFSGRAGQAIFLTAGGMGFIQSDGQGPAWIGIPSL